jgi:hypothetical protein
MVDEKKSAYSVEGVVVGLGRVDLGQQEASLAASMVAVNVARHGEAALSPWKIRMWKNVSISRMRSAVMLCECESGESEANKREVR